MEPSCTRPAIAVFGQLLLQFHTLASYNFRYGGHNWLLSNNMPCPQYRGRMEHLGNDWEHSVDLHYLSSPLARPLLNKQQ
jgi:hypothetical protein